MDSCQAYEPKRLVTEASAPSMIYPMTDQQDGENNLPGLLERETSPSSSPSGVSAEKGGYVRERYLLQEHPHFLDAPNQSIAQRAENRLREFFQRKGHHPSPAQWVVLRAQLEVMAAMANGTCSPDIHLSGLDPGVGKTSAVIAFLRELCRSNEHSAVGVLICVPRLEQIVEIVSGAGLVPEQFAAQVGDETLRQLSVTPPDAARILFTTHSLFERRCGGRHFQDADLYFYQGRPRQVRIWDEAILPGRPLHLPRYAINSLLHPLSRHFPDLVRDLERLSIELGSAVAGHQVYLPDLPLQHGVDLDAVRDALSKSDQRKLEAQAAVLWMLLGKVVTVRRAGKGDDAVLDYKDSLPPDLAPVLVLDASARVREVYAEWAAGRGGVRRLPDAPKSYANLTIHVWNHAGSKSAFAKTATRQELFRGIADTVLSRPDEPWLIVHHKDAGEALDEHLRKALPRATYQRVSLLNWGRHDATNQYRDVPNVILAGTRFYPPPFYEALGRLAAGRPSALGSYGEDAVERVTRGEHRHLILQAALRGAARKSLGDGCPPSNLYLIAAARHGIRQELPKVFPEAVLKDWRPIETKLPPTAARAVAMIVDSLGKSANAPVPFKVIQAALGWKDCRDFRKHVRQNSAFQQRLAELGIGEVASRPGGQPRAFGYV